MYKKAWQRIKEAKSIVLSSHVLPDGDTLGSTLALYNVIKTFNKNVHLYNPSKELPRGLNFLPNIDKVSNELPYEWFDLVITCDCGAFSRTKLKRDNYTLINIDHHKTNDNFGDINIVNPLAPSATMVVYDLLQKNDILITLETALCLYVGFATDTGFFTYGNIDEKALKMVLNLTKTGLNLEQIGTKLKQSVPLSLMRLRQHVYDVFYLIERATVGVVIITQKDLQRVGCKLEDTKNILNLVRELATVKVAIMIVQKEYGGSKISLRSKGDLDVSAIAKHFSGGGHKNAAGFEVENFSPESLVEEIIKVKNRIDNEK